MDFDLAAQRLARDQKLKKGRRPVEISAKAKQEAERNKQQQAVLARQREQQRKQADYVEKYYRQCEQSLGVKYLCTLSATSIHGEGDKIALPPSVLEQLTAADGGVLESSVASTPWMFRVALRDPEYSFLASSQLREIAVPEDDDDEDDHDGADSDHEQDDGRTNEAYLDELRHKYLSYTHATVVEFTQEEGNVGLPEPIASALIEMARRQTVPNRSQPVATFRTKDPAAASATDDAHAMELDDGDGDEKTPGHLAWGAFDLPDMPIEISLVKLPKGRGATLTPTKDAIHNGFYELDDIKLVLEQALVRTRATLTVGDTVHSWHRGRKYDLQVSALRPSTFSAVLCLNTDLEVEFGSHDSDKTTEQTSENERTVTEASHDTLPPPAVPVDLPAEPAQDADNVCLVQIQANARQSRRRFDMTTSTVKDLFAFASTVALEGDFQLVTRFPRSVLTRSDGAKTLLEAGITSKQELFMVERL